MSKIRTIIVDDEKKARDGLYSLVKDDPLIDVVGICQNGLEAIEQMNNNTIHLAFLDIQMPGIDGFEVINSIKEDKRPIVIFVTAFDNYALKAFDYHALDYLLKPFTDKRFHESLEIAKKNILNNSLKETRSKLNTLINTLNENLNSNLESDIINSQDFIDKRLVIKTSSKKIIFIDLDDIEWIEAFDYYVKIHTLNETFLVRNSMKRLEFRLPNPQFLRIHKSTIVNINFIKHLVSIGNSEYELTLKKGDILKVSRSYIKNLNKIIAACKS